MINRTYKIADILRMIEEGQLITTQQINLQFDLSQEQIDDAIRDQSLEVIYSVGARKYFLRDQVELLHEAIIEELNGSHSSETE